MKLSDEESILYAIVDNLTTNKEPKRWIKLTAYIGEQQLPKTRAEFWLAGVYYAWQQSPEQRHPRWSAMLKEYQTIRATVQTPATFLRSASYRQNVDKLLRLIEIADAILSALTKHQANLNKQ